MNENDENKIHLLDIVKSDSEPETAFKSGHQTNPILKKLLFFRQEKSGKFSVKDLFKK